MVPGLVRGFSAPPASSTPAGDSPLDKIFPPLVKLPRQVVETTYGVTSKVVTGAASSGPVKNMVSSFAEKVIVGESIVKLSDVNVPFWAYWLSYGGYTSHSGFKKFAEAALAQLPKLEPSAVTTLVSAFHVADYYDKALFSAVASHIAEHYAKYETDELLTILSALHKFKHYDTVLLDDIADSLAYCNHYLAPMKSSATALATALDTYAAAGHDRADLFATLSRGFSEISLGKLPAEAAKDASLTALRAFRKFHFWPDSAEALLYVAKSYSQLSGDEAKEVESLQSVFEEVSGGKLHVFKEGDDVDLDHWYSHNTHAPTSYTLYALRDSLVPKEYSPAALRPQK